MLGSSKKFRKLMTKQYYILKLDSYSGENSSLVCNAGGLDSMYCVLLADNSNAEIVDWGNSNIDELLSAWKDISFKNAGSIVK